MKGKCLSKMLLIIAVVMVLFFSIVFLDGTRVYAYEDVNDPNVEEDTNENEQEVFSYKDLLYMYYEDVIEYALLQDVEIDLDYAKFEKDFYDSQLSIGEFVEQCKYQIDAIYFTNEGMTPSLYSSTSLGDQWYSNTGLFLPQNPIYDSKLRSTVQAGDILYEANSFGHIAIVKGLDYEPRYAKTYIKVIEAVQEHGVCYGVLDDNRFIERCGTILRVNTTTTKQYAAISWIEAQVGKGYDRDLEKNTSPYENDWYCSELVWAGYYAQGVDIEQNSFVGITPLEILNKLIFNKVIKHGDIK